MVLHCGVKIITLLFMRLFNFRMRQLVRVINDVPIMDNITPYYVNLGILKFPDIVKLYSCLFLFDIFNDFGAIQSYNTTFIRTTYISILLVMSLQNNYMFSFSEQTLESSLPQWLNVIFGTIFPFLAAQGLLKTIQEFPLQSLFITILRLT